MIDLTPIMINAFNRTLDDYKHHISMAEHYCAMHALTNDEKFHALYLSHTKKAQVIHDKLVFVYRQALLA